MLSLTKLDVARRQLRAALELWFADGDPVSIHALVYAAHEIIHRLYRNSGGKDLLFDSSVIKDEHRSEFAKLLKEDANFFKHPDKDLHETREFNPRVNDLFLIMSTTGMQRMGEVGDVESAFMFWLYLQHPNWFPEDVAKERIPEERLNKMRSLNKHEFLQAFLAAMEDKRRHGVGITGK
jgi:hypothetical protein